MLNAGQQLATSIGVAVLGTIFFDVARGGHFHNALIDCLVVQVVLMVGLLVLSLLLPRHARQPTPNELVTDEKFAATNG